jgi:hypothetical protein
LGPFVYYAKNEVLINMVNGPNKIECYPTLAWKGLLIKKTSLLGPFVHYEEKEVLYKRSLIL